MLLIYKINRIHVDELTIYDFFITVTRYGCEELQMKLL